VIGWCIQMNDLQACRGLDGVHARLQGTMGGKARYTRVTIFAGQAQRSNDPLAEEIRREDMQIVITGITLPKSEMHLGKLMNLRQERSRACRRDEQAFFRDFLLRARARSGRGGSQTGAMEAHCFSLF
jgi:hypothetical protein